MAEDIHIGKVAETAWKHSGLTASAFADAIGQQRQNVRHIFSRRSMDTELLFQISVAVREDLFQVYSDRLPFEKRAASTPVADDVDVKLLKLELEAAKTEIAYLKEIVALLKQK